MGEGARGAADRGASASGGEPTFTVAIPTRNRGELIGETLQAVQRLQFPGLDILVVDQSTDDRTRRVVARLAAGDPRVRYHASATVGSAAARNVGAQQSDAEIVAFTDDDCIVTDEWLPALLAEFAEPRVAAVYGRLLPYERGARTGTEVGLKDSLERVVYAARRPPWHIGHGGNMAFRRADLLAVGGFDPLLGAGGALQSGEDADIAYRLLSRGRCIAYSPQALAYHKHWKTWPAQQAMERAYGIGMGAQVSKHLRCGDPYAWRLLATWLYELGVRRVGAGLLKWRSRKVMYLGYCQLVYPWFGLWKAAGYEVDRRTVTFIPPAAPQGEADWNSAKDQERSGWVVAGPPQRPGL